MIATKPPVVMPDEKIPFTHVGICARISGANSTPNPQAKLTARTNIALRSIS